MKILKIIVYFLLLFSPALLLYMHLSSQSLGWEKKKKPKKVFVNPIKNQLRSYNIDNNIPTPSSSSNLDLDSKMSLSSIDSTITIDSSIIDNVGFEPLMRIRKM